MLISFFEEFPTNKNLAKLKLITWPTKLYLAAKSLEEFQQLKKSIRNKHIKELIYWPILKKSEGYWISPFSQRKALLRTFQELKNKNLPVMLDLELPTRQNILLYLTQLFNFRRNKHLIQDFINSYSGKVYLAEYYPEGKNKEKWLSFLGLHYSHPQAKIIKMVYHSLHDFNKDFISNELQRGKEEYQDNFIVAFGTIAKGITKKEPILSPKQLKKDLILAKNLGIKEIIIFRLGGLNKEYTKILK